MNTNLPDEISELIRKYPGMDADVKILLLRASIKDLETRIKNKQIVTNINSKIKIYANNNSN